MVAIDRGITEGPRAENIAAAGLSLLGSLVIVARPHGIQLPVPQPARARQDLRHRQPSLAPAAPAPHAPARA